MVKYVFGLSQRICPKDGIKIVSELFEKKTRQDLGPFKHNLRLVFLQIEIPKWERLPKAAAPSFSSYLLWSICGLYCRLYMAYVQLVYGDSGAHILPMYGLIMAYPICIFIYAKFTIFTSTSVFEHAHVMCLRSV